ncbi:CBU_0585 family protein [Legionella sp.]|uniref:CBU_0585 family protein n=1 Tax=Legionella sp. TaxID=459 RepID=UPI003CC0230B
MNTNDIDKAYVSPYDKFLFEFDATHGKSESQIKEIIKHAHLAKIRDDKDYKDKNDEIWKDF